MPYDQVSNPLAEILTVLFVGSEFCRNSDSQGLPNVFSWELNISKLLVVEEVGGTNFHGLIFWGFGKMKFS